MSRDTMVIKEGGFEFRPSANGHAVYRKSKQLGEIVTHQEPNGRHCFRLGLDTRKAPRTYRGKVTAAEALLALHELVVESDKGGFSPAEMILRAWERTPSTV